MEQDTRCTSLMPMKSGMYRCMYENRDGHTEHQYNYYRKLTDEEYEKWIKPYESNDIWVDKRLP